VTRCTSRAPLCVYVCEANEKKRLGIIKIIIRMFLGLGISVVQAPESSQRALCLVYECCGEIIVVKFSVLRSNFSSKWTTNSGGARKENQKKQEEEKNLNFFLLCHRRFLLSSPFLAWLHFPTFFFIFMRSRLFSSPPAPCNERT
jgi:hypothetical protein